MGKRLGYITEGFENCSAGVKSVIDGVVEKIKAAGALVDEISLPEVNSGKLYLYHKQKYM